MTALIPGTFNSRDLGGAATRDGVVRSGQIIRSDAPVDLGAAGHAAIRALGIRTAIDLREPVERRLDLADLDGLGLDQQSHRIIGDSLTIAKDMSLQEVYRHLLDIRGASLTNAVRALARPGALPAIVFCSAGKDRTGLVSALTLAAAGADDESIVTDYAATQANMHGAFRDAIISRARSAGITEQEIAVKVGSPPDLMRDTLRWLREERGGAHELLLRHGMTPGELDALQDALVVPRAAQAA